MVNGEKAVVKWYLPNSTVVLAILGEFYRCVIESAVLFAQVKLDTKKKLMKGGVLSCDPLFGVLH